MTLAEFTAQFNSKNTIILLEGKRNVLESYKEKLIQLGYLLASICPWLLLEAATPMVPTFIFL